MSKVVLDASIALAWCFPDEASAYADEVLLALEGNPILVPAIWPLEIANAVLAGERQNSLRASELQLFLSFLEHLSIVQDVQPVVPLVATVLPVARRHGLSAYDAAYLELALRHGVCLATFDRKLQKAAKALNVTLFAP